MSTERYKPPAWALNAAREAMEFAGIAFLSDAAVESVAGRMVEQRSIGDRAGFARGIEAAVHDIDVLVQAGVGAVPGTRINVVQAMANGIRLIPYSGPTGDDGGGR